MRPFHSLFMRCGNPVNVSEGLMDSEQHKRVPGVLTLGVSLQAATHPDCWEIHVNNEMYILDM